MDRPASVRANAAHRLTDAQHLLVRHYTAFIALTQQDDVELDDLHLLKDRFDDASNDFADALHAYAESEETDSSFYARKHRYFVITRDAVDGLFDDIVGAPVPYITSAPAVPPARDVVLRGRDDLSLIGDGDSSQGSYDLGAVLPQPPSDAPSNASGRRSNAPSHASERRSNASERRSNAPSNASGRRSNAPSHASARRYNAPSNASGRRCNAPSHASARRYNAPSNAPGRRYNAPSNGSTRHSNASSRNSNPSRASRQTDASTHRSSYRTRGSDYTDPVGQRVAPAGSTTASRYSRAAWEKEIANNLERAMRVNEPHSSDSDTILDFTSDTSYKLSNEISLSGGSDFDSGTPVHATPDVFSNRVVLTSRLTHTPIVPSEPSQPSFKNRLRSSKGVPKLPKLNWSERKAAIHDWVNTTVHYTGLGTSRRPQQQPDPSPPSYRRQTLNQRKAPAQKEKISSQRSNSKLERMRAELALEREKLGAQNDALRAKRIELNERATRTNDGAGTFGASQPLRNETNHQRFNQDVMMCMLRQVHRSQGNEEMKFDGDVLRYPYFRRHFENSVVNLIDDRASCFQILLNECTGEARKAIEHFGMYDDPAQALTEALHVLEKNYGNTPALVQTYLTHLHAPNPVRDTAEGLQDLLADMRTCKTVLRNSGQSAALDQLVNIKPIWLRLPTELKKSYHERVQGITPTFSILEEVIEEGHAAKLDHVGQWMLEAKQIRKEKLRINVVTRCSNSSSSSSAHSESSSTVSSGRVSCPACDRTDQHLLSKCTEFFKLTQQERYEIVRRGRYCFGCLQMGHRIQHCRSYDTLRCGVGGCSGKHHFALHIQRLPQQRRPDSSH